MTRPAYLSMASEQMIIKYPIEISKEIKSVPIEDIGILVLENPQLTITHTLLARLAKANVCVISCDEKHMPIAINIPLEGHSEQSERHRYQVDASLPLKKNLWQQTISSKILNQYNVLKSFDIETPKLAYWATNVKSGDSQNYEAQAASVYWRVFFEDSDFTRDQYGIAPNNALNYGYAVLRSVTARSIVASGLIPTLGIFHRNKYNAFCLADDLMEPYRPFVDALVKDIISQYGTHDFLTTEIKKELLSIPVLDVIIDGKASPLMVAMSRTTHSLYECFAGISRKLIYPNYE